MSTKTLARKLRKNSTDAEQHLWQHLRGRQILNTKFHRQHNLHPYIVDFICLDKKLIIEVDGSQHFDQQKYDEERTIFLEPQGFQVLRFWNNEVLIQIDSVLEVIYRALNETPHPNPLPKGERE